MVQKWRFTREVTLRLPRLSFVSIRAVVLAAASVVAVASALPSSQAPQSNEERIAVFSSNAMQGVLQEVVPKFERESGRRVSITYGPAAVLARQVDKGDRFDLAILTPAFVDAAVRSGAILRDSVVTIARSPIALAIRKGSRKPDIRTANALKATLMNSRAIASAREGASGPFFSELLQKLGIADEVKPKIKLTESGVDVGRSVANGEADLGVIPVSEIMQVPEAEVLGRFPGDFGGFVTMVAGIGSQSRQKEGAVALMRFLMSPEVTAVFQAKGMERQ